VNQMCRQRGAGRLAVAEGRKQDICTQNFVKEGVLQGVRKGIPPKTEKERRGSIDETIREKPNVVGEEENGSTKGGFNGGF